MLKLVYTFWIVIFVAGTIVSPDVVVCVQTDGSLELETSLNGMCECQKSDDLLHSDNEDGESQDRDDLHKDIDLDTDNRIIRISRSWSDNLSEAPDPFERQALKFITEIKVSGRFPDPLQKIFEPLYDITQSVVLLI